MIVTAMLAWYDESPALLRCAVESLAGLADRVVALDGGWEGWPGARSESPPEQREAIMEAADAVGLHCETYSESSLWSGQVAKRDQLLGLAAFGSFGSDWVLPLDADWEFVGTADARRAARAELETTDADAVTVGFVTPPLPAADNAATEWHAGLAGTEQRYPLLMRALPGLRVEGLHWRYTGLRDGQRVSLWGGGYPVACTADLRADVRVVHHCFERDAEHVAANRAYCEAREAYRVRRGVEL